MPLAISLRNIENSLDDELFQILYADDAAGGGTLDIIRKWWSKVKEEGPGYGYYPEPSKSWLIVKEDKEEKAKELFPDVNITTVGHRYLGSFIGSEDGMKNWLKNEVKTWVEDIEQLSDIAYNEPQLAYSAYTIGLSKK